MKNAITSRSNKVHLSRLWWYLILIIVLSAFCYITLNVWLLPYSIEYSETGKMTAGYFLYPTSNHYGDSVIGFAITIFIWAFALTAIYKTTRSVIACALYHTFIDAIGAVYDWNGL